MTRCRRDRCGDPVGGYKKGQNRGGVFTPAEISCDHKGVCCWHTRKGCSLYLDACDKHDSVGCSVCPPTQSVYGAA